MKIKAKINKSINFLQIRKINTYTYIIYDLVIKNNELKYKLN